MLPRIAATIRSTTTDKATTSGRYSTRPARESRRSRILMIVEEARNRRLNEMDRLRHITIDEDLRAFAPAVGDAVP